MAKIRTEEVVTTALAVLDDTGLDAFTTRALAGRLGVESATLYWHFRDKAALLREMAAAALAQHHTLEAPSDPACWDNWFAAHARSFRDALRAHRDGARLHAGTVPNTAERERIAPKVAYLVRAGFARSDALMALLAVSQFTIGNVLEQQARSPSDLHAPPTGPFAAELASTMATGDDAAFEFGLSLVIAGLREQLARRARAAAGKARRRAARPARPRGA